MRSIRGRILLLVLGLLSLSLSVISYRSYRDAHHEIEELFDAELAQHARLLAGMLRPDLPAELRAALQASLDRASVLMAEAGTEAFPAGHEYEKKLAFVVFDGDGKVLLRSASAPADAVDQLLDGLQRRLGLAPDAPRAVAALQARLPGYHDLSLAGEQWRLFALREAGDEQWVLVGERADVRGELVTKIARQNLMPDLVGLPLVGLLVWLAVGWGLRPLDRMIELIKARHAENLAPLLLAPLPRELEPMVASLNRLLLQVTELLEREKRFLAYAAHELRTPLAVLRIHAQNALQAPDPADREDALRQLGAGVERATRLVAQLLTLARLEPNAVTVAAQRVDLAARVRDELAELIPLALERHQDLALEAPPEADCRIEADAPGVGILLQNLVSNAIQHTPAGGAIRVVLKPTPQTVELRVQDSGPGIPAELHGKVFERFYRQGPGQGAGLGLSIVARIVELHGAQIALGDSPLGGLEVAVSFPRALQRAGPSASSR